MRNRIISVTLASEYAEPEQKQGATGAEVIASISKHLTEWVQSIDPDASVEANDTSKIPSKFVSPYFTVLCNDQAADILIGNDRSVARPPYLREEEEMETVDDDEEITADDRAEETV